MPKIVQSFWSSNQTSDNAIKNTGGWLSAEYHWMAWVLSCLQLHKYYANIELITDTIGKTILIDLLELPYSTIKIELDCLNKYNKNLWSLAKIYAYGSQ